MKRRPIKQRLVIAISCFILVCPAYLLFSNLSEFNLSPTDLSFESPDQDDQLDGQQHQSGSLLSGLFFITSLPGTDFIEQSHLFSFPLTSHSQNKSILRC
jgi:hypothetical protein